MHPFDVEKNVLGQDLFPWTSSKVLGLSQHHQQEELRKQDEVFCGQFVG
jgi:hypothetical protein